MSQSHAVSFSSGKAKTGFALLAAAALAAAPILLGSSAFAADVNLGPADIAPYENGDEASDTYNYDQWHVGSNELESAELEASFLFGDCTVTAVNPGSDWSDWPQLLKGYPVDARPDSEAAIRDIIAGTSLEVASGAATLQFAFFIDWASGGIDDAPWTEFTTVRNTTPGSGTVTIGDSTPITLTRPIDNWANIDEFFEYVNADGSEGEPAVGIELLGVGFNASAAQNSEVTSFTFDGNTYYFGEDCAPVVEDPIDEPEEEVPATPTPPTKVDTAAGSADASAILLMSGLLLAAGAVGFAATKRRATNE